MNSRLARRIVEALATYFVGWTLCYMLVLGADFSHFAEYLILAWTTPGELPAMINFGALLLTAIGVALLAARRRWVRRAAPRG